MTAVDSDVEYLHYSKPRARLRNLSAGKPGFALLRDAAEDIESISELKGNGSEPESPYPPSRKPAQLTRLKLMVRDAH
jgi:hypothetical protein